MTACVRIRPGGPAVVVAATVVGVLVLLVGLVLALLVAYLITTDPPGWPALIPLMPSLLVMALSLWLVRRAASGFVLEAAGIRQAARHRALLPWADVGGLRWCRTRWWGRHNHQLVADLRDGETVVVWGVRNPVQHGRLVSGLVDATARGLIPPNVARGHHLCQAWPVVAGDLNRARAPARS